VRIVLFSQIGTIKRWIAAGASVVSAVAVLMALSGSVAHSQSTASASPVPAHGTPVSCGTMVNRWGAATADDVRVQLLSVQRGMIWGMTSGTTGTPITATPAVPVLVLSVELEIANHGQETIRIDPRDVILTTCSGRTLTPPANLLTMKSPLGSFGPGETRRGQLHFPLDPLDAPAGLTVNIQEEYRTGARIECPLVLDTGTATTGAISVGCSAQGGSGQSGAPGVAGSGVSPTGTAAAGQ
jgi:hypothetical protein